jgi:hypothetical protein
MDELGNIPQSVQVYILLHEEEMRWDLGRVLRGSMGSGDGIGGTSGLGSGLAKEFEAV